MRKHLPIKIISGGQTGVDRAALDYAIDKSIPCGGWCPKGRKAEDGRIPDRYPVEEMNTASYAERTKKNVVGSDATLVIYDRLPDRGTKRTIEECLSLNRPVLYITFEAEDRIPEIRNWLLHYRVRTLNIAGPRESNDPGIHRKSYAFLERLFGV